VYLEVFWILFHTDAAVSAPIRFFNVVIQKLNLSSRPFRNRALPWLLALFLCVAAGLGLIYTVTQWRNVSAETSIVKGDIDRIEGELKKLGEESDRVKEELAPEQKQLLIAAHRLVARKSFSWSRLFADLEGVLPRSVSVSRVNVENVYKQGDRTQAELEFSVLSRDYGSVISMIDNMNASGTFRAEMRGQALQKSDSGDYSEYSMSLIYLPRSGVNTTPESGAQIAAAQSSGQPASGQPAQQEAGR
jgi:Tfp pilus assembly protein PilN